MDTMGIRYIVTDVDAAIRFYESHLGFVTKMHPAPGFALLEKGAIRLFLNAPGAGGAGHAMPDGQMPAPGGWNRFMIEVDDLEAFVSRLRAGGARFRNEIVHGQGGRQILLEDPSGNPIEVFEAARK